MKAIIRAAVACLAIAMAVPMFGLPASAQYAPTVEVAASGASLFGTGEPGDTVTVTATGTDGAVSTFTTTVGADGRWSVSTASLPAGTYSTVVSTSSGGSASLTFTRAPSQAIAVDYPGSFSTMPALSNTNSFTRTNPISSGQTSSGSTGGTGGGLAHTGSSTDVPVIAGASLIGLGGLLVLAARKRR